MVRTMPTIHNEEIELYIRTYYSLLRSSEAIRIRSLEETHAAMNSSLHQQANSTEIDLSALTYCALRLPDVIRDVRLLILGQMEDVFAREGYPSVEEWPQVRARARRRKYYFDAESGVLAAFIASVSDIDDIIPCLTTLQIEWNKMHVRLISHSAGDLLKALPADARELGEPLATQVQQALGLTDEDFAKLQQVWTGRLLVDNLRRAAAEELDLRIRVLGSGLSDYRRSVQQWWLALIEESGGVKLDERPIYFVSSNIHSMANLLSGYVMHRREDILRYVREINPEHLTRELSELPESDNGQSLNFLYYASRLFTGWSGSRDEMMAMELESGIRRVSEPDCLDIEAQIFDLSHLQADRIDPRVNIFSAEEWELLKQSDALVFNIDYPLGMAAYHILSQVSTAGGRILGVYVLGKAASLNGRVGDVMLPNVVYDEHSRNSFLFRNSFRAQDVATFLNYGTVFDNQKAVTVRGTVLQNRRFMGVFYQEGYTDIEMEAGPYLAAI